MEVSTPIRFLQRAVELAIENVRAGRGGPFGAVVVQGDTIVAEGTNLVTSTNDPTAHAEIVAIREACRVFKRYQLEGCELYASCEPCPMCLGAIYWSHLSAVWFAGSREDAAAAGFDDSFIYEQLLLPVEQRVVSMRQMLREEALEAFQTWIDKQDKVPY